MEKFYYCYNSSCKQVNSTSVYSFDPYFFAIKKLLFSELRQLTFYIEKLKDFNQDMSIYRDKVIEFVYVLVVNLDFKRENFFEIIQDLNKNKCDLKKRYQDLCKVKNQEIITSNQDELDLSSKTAILKVLNDYEKSIDVSANLDSPNISCLYNVILTLVLNACNYLIELQEYGIDLSNEKDLVINLINSSNPNFTDEKLFIDKINDFVKTNYELYKILNSAIKERYGNVKNTTVNTSVKQGKSILVSGNSFLDLEHILLVAKENDINVYTHSSLINAFAHEKFSEFKNLVGHYQPAKNNFSIDFSSFPGPIFISKNNVSEINVIRGQLYTNSKYPPFGFGKISNLDFSPIVEYAKNSEGFMSSLTNVPILVGLSDKKLNSILDVIIEKINSGLLRKIIILGSSNLNDFDFSYMEKLVSIATKNNFIFSLSAEFNKRNFLHINSFSDFSYVYKILEKIQSVGLEEKVSIILFDNTPDFIPTLFNIINLKVKNVFVSPLCYSSLNPNCVKTLNSLFSIKEITSPQNDLKKM